MSSDNGTGRLHGKIKIFDRYLFSGRIKLKSHPLFDRVYLIFKMCNPKEQQFLFIVHFQRIIQLS